jgi:hypothetical protein
MYDVELGSIWIWKNIKCSFDNHYYKNRCFLLVFMIGFTHMLTLDKMTKLAKKHNCLGQAQRVS